MPEITVGRDEDDIAEYGAQEGTAYLGKHIVGEKKEASTANPLYMDIARPHVAGIFGKRGSGKSYTLGVLAEELVHADETVQDNVSGLIVDSMGIFWSMNTPNNEDAVALDDWGISPAAMHIDVYIPEGHVNQFQDRGIPFDATFAIKPGELTAGDWALAFDLTITDPIGVLLERVITELQDDHGTDYGLTDIIDTARHHDDFDRTVKQALVNRFEAARHWGVFSRDGTSVQELTERGTVTILDVSMFQDFSRGWSARALIVGLLARKILMTRMASKRIEEIEEMEGAPTSDSPIVWMLIDEAHQFVPDDGKTPASEPLLQWAKIGREPGVSLVLATQQPNRLHPNLLSQMDILLTHRLTARNDITALGDIMQTYMQYDMTEYLDNLPRQTGAGIILDDNSERVYRVQVRPRMSWHAGGTPTAIKKERT